MALSLASRRFFARSIMASMMVAAIASLLLGGYWLLTGQFLNLLIGIHVLLLQNLLTLRNPWAEKFSRHVASFRDYFRSVQFIEDSPIEPNTPQMYVFHPHSVLALGIIMSLQDGSKRNFTPSGLLEKSKILCARPMLWLPFIGFICRLSGLEGINPANFKRLLRKGESLSFLPGGFEEATLTTPKQMRVFIKQRKGFVKYGLQTGHQLVPVLVMNEHKAFHTFDYLPKLRLLFNKIKVPGVWFLGKWGLPIPQWDLDIKIVMGRPIPLPKLAEPSAKEVDQYHEQYMHQLTQLYQKYKGLNGGVPFKLY